MQIKKSFRKSILRCLMVFLAVAVTVTMTPVGMNEAYADTTLTKETPEILVSGTAVIDGESYDASNVNCEKAYTLEELKAMGEKEATFSRVKARPNDDGSYKKELFNAKGVYVSSLLLGTKVNTQIDVVKFISGDDEPWIATFDPKGEYKNGSQTTTGLDVERFYYPKLKEDSAEDSQSVKAMIAWTVNGESSACKLMVGQLTLEDRNSPLYTSNLQKIIGGKELTKAELTVDGKEYTRGDILLMERTIRSDEKDTVRGVSLNELLKDYDNSTKVKFKMADGNVYVITKGDLVKGNSVLAYEVLTEENPDAVARAVANVGYSGIYDSDNSGNYGLFRLYSDNQNEPLKMVNAIEIVKEDSGEATDNPPAVDNTEDNASDDNNDKNADTEDKPDTSAKTGDEMPIGLLAGVLAAAAAGIFGTLCIRRKTN